MRKILQKIAWKTNRWSTKITLFDIYLGGDHHRFGFRLLNIERGIMKQGSLFEITWSFPTVTHRGELNIDLFFMFDTWDSWCIDMIDRKLWGTKLTKWEKFNLKLNNFIRSIG